MPQIQEKQIKQHNSLIMRTLNKPE